MCAQVCAIPDHEQTGTPQKVERSNDPRNLGGSKMNWDRIEGNWKQFSGKVKEKWGQLTDDDLAKVNGNREQLEGILQQRYGYAKDKAKAEIDQWSKGL
jgi:uncharacterized protein YjbJ (UPF0337 family)